MTGVCPELSTDQRARLTRAMCLRLKLQAQAGGAVLNLRPAETTVAKTDFFLHTGPATCIRIGSDQYFMLAIVILRAERTDLMTRAEGGAPED